MAICGQKMSSTASRSLLSLRQVSEAQTDESHSTRAQPTGASMSTTAVGIRNCRFEFECDQSWTDLETTDDAQVRHCGQCSKSVHLCTTDADIARAIRDNLCVAIPAPAPKRKAKRGALFTAQVGGISRWPGPSDLD